MLADATTCRRCGAIPTAVRAALKGDGALLARLIRESRALRGARLPARLLGRPLRDRLRDHAAAVGPGDANRPASARSRSSASRPCPGRVRAVRPGVVVEDEIDLCLRWPDVPRPPRGAALPYPSVPTLILQGPRTCAPRPSGPRGRGPDPGGEASSCPASATPRSATRELRRRRDPAFRPRPPAADDVPARWRPACRRSSRARRRSTRCAARPAARARSVASCARSRPPSTTSASCSRRPTLGRGGGLRGGRGAIRGGRLMLHALPGRGRRVCRGGRGGDSLTLRVSGLEGRRRNGDAALAWAPDGEPRWAADLTAPPNPAGDGAARAALPHARGAVAALTDLQIGRVADPFARGLRSMGGVGRTMLSGLDSGPPDARERGNPPAY